MRQTIYLLAIYLLASSTVLGQTVSKCDTIYDFVDTMPQYGKGEAALMKYIRNEFIPVVSDCMKRDGELIASLRIVLIIDQNGNVVDATFPKNNTTSACKEEMKKKLETMAGWSAGRLNGKKICCYVTIPIACLKWSDK